MNLRQFLYNEVILPDIDRAIALTGKAILQCYECPVYDECNPSMRECHETLKMFLDKEIDDGK